MVARVLERRLEFHVLVRGCKGRRRSSGQAKATIRRWIIAVAETEDT